MKRVAMKHYQLGKRMGKLQAVARRHLLQTKAASIADNFAVLLIKRAEEIDKDFLPSVEVNLEETKNQMLHVSELLMGDMMENGQELLNKIAKK